MTKSRLIGLLAILVVAFLVFRPGDEPSDADKGHGGLDSSTDRQLQPREPAFLRPGADYGLAQRRGAKPAPQPYGGWGYYPQGPYPNTYQGGYGSPDRYGTQAQIRTDGYRFRPLSEQEKKRSQPSYADQYPTQYPTPYQEPAPYYPSAETQRHPAAQAPYYAQPSYPQRQQEAYSFRPLEQSPAASGRWQSPYDQPGRGYDQYSQDPRTSPPDPQWGWDSTPPSQRMYPSYYRNLGRRLTAR